MREKILYLRAVGMWDVIMSIPKWNQIYKQWKELHVLYYDFRYYWKNFHYDIQLLQKIIKESGLIKKVMYIPYNKIKLLLFIIKNFRRFDEVWFPVKTKRWKIRWRLLWKTYRYIFESADDRNKYEDIVTWELWRKELLSDYKGFFDNIDRKDDIWAQKKKEKKYITIFPSSYERSINASEREKIISFIKDKWYNVILLGGKREKWLTEDLQHLIIREEYVHDYIGKTSFEDLLSFLENADINISCNGGVMRLWHLLNKNNISIHTVSSLILQPPTDNINCFAIRPVYTCPKPCQAWFYRYRWQKWIPVCVFHGTKDEGICRNISWSIIIKKIQIILDNFKS